MKEHLRGKAGEDAVSKVAEGTYLKYWCYPSPKDERGDKKEICDLLILFKETVIIVSIKNYSFKGNYERYFRSTLEKAMSQIDGAERKLFSLNRSIYFNHPSKGEFEFISEKYSVVQRLIVNLNTVPLFYPAGKPSRRDKFIHIFNWFAFLKVVEELDTIPDFVQYLVEREKAFCQKQIVMMTGQDKDWTTRTNEEFVKYTDKLEPTKKPFILFSGNELDLLAEYFFSAKKFEYPFDSNEYSGANLEYDGRWDRYMEKKEVQRKKEEDQISYFLDEFIEREVLQSNDDLRIEIATELLSLSRFERRIVGSHFASFIKKYHMITDYDMVRRYGTINGMIISFFIHGNGIDFHKAMKMMSIAVQGYSYWEGYKTKKALMIGCNAALTQFKFAYSPNVEKLSQQEEEEVIHNLTVLKWFQRIENFVYNFKEYPDD